MSDLLYKPTDLTALALYRIGVLSRSAAMQIAAVDEKSFAEMETDFDDSLLQGAVVDRGLKPLTFPPGFLLSVLVPVFNERKTIEALLEKVGSIEVPKEIVVVDDGSTDGTREMLKQSIGGRFPDVRVIYHDRNQGKGAAIRTALTHAVGNVSVIQDADLEYDPGDFLSLLEPIVDGRADAVFGSRFAGGGPHRVHLYWHYLGNQLLTTLANMLANINLTDMETCYKLVKTDLLRKLDLKANRFDIEPEITIKLARAHARIYEVPISYSGRDYREGKKIGWRDGFHALWAMLRFRFF